MASTQTACILFYSPQRSRYNLWRDLFNIPAPTLYQLINVGANHAYYQRLTNIAIVFHGRKAMTIFR